MATATIKSNPKESTEKSHKVRDEFLGDFTKVSEKMMSPDGKDRYDAWVNGGLMKGRSMMYRSGAWCVERVSDGVYVLTHGLHKVTLYLAQTVVNGLAAGFVSLKWVWDGLLSVFSACLAGVTTAWDASVKFCKEAGGKLKKSATKSSKDVEVELSADSLGIKG